MPEALIDLIYESAVLTELWPTVLDRLSGIADGSAASLLSLAPDDFRYLATPAYVPVMQGFKERGRGSANLRPERAFASRHPGFQIDTELCTPEELASDETYVEFVLPHGFRSTMGTVIRPPNGDLIAFDLARHAKLPPFTRDIAARLDLYRPHLARAAMLSARFGLERVANAAAVLETVGLPAAFLTFSGRVLAANLSFDDLQPQVRTRLGDGLIFAHVGANALLNEALAGVRAGALDGASIPVPGIGAHPERTSSLIAHLLPVRRAAHDLFATANLVLVVTPLRSGPAPDPELLQGLFDLTPAEARVSRGISSGMTIEQLAEQFRVSRETLRTQLKAAMIKIGVNRQVDLARLLAGCAPLPDARTINAV